MLDTIGNRIKDAIENSGLTQSFVADQCNVSKQAITGWIKKNSIDKTNLLVVSKLTGYSYEWLLTGKGVKLSINYKDNNLIDANMEVKEPGFLDITEYERGLVLLYRQLPYDQQEFIRVSINGLIDKNNRPKDQKTETPCKPNLYLVKNKWS